MQRRHQKVIEEAPSPFMTPELRKAMGEAAVKLARAGDYTNAGTVEFLVDAQRNFYFLEMNTRLQVEHPVTEMVTSLDLVKLQLRIAAGEALPFRQEEIELRGHAIECRIYAEDPDNNFFPSPGKIVDCRVPTGPGIRLDEGIYAGWTVPNEYDPMLGKLIAWGGDREEAMARMRRALRGILCERDKNQRLAFSPNPGSSDFRSGAIYTRWLDDFLSAEPAAKSGDSGREEIQAEQAAAIAAFLWHTSHTDGANTSAVAGDYRIPVENRNSAGTSESRASSSDQRRESLSGAIVKLQIEIDGKKRQVEMTQAGERPVWTIDGRRLEADATEVSPGIYSILINGRSFEVRMERLGAELRAIAGSREFRVVVQDEREWRRNRGSAVGSGGPSADLGSDARAKSCACW